MITFYCFYPLHILDAPYPLDRILPVLLLWCLGSHSICNCRAETTNGKRFSLLSVSGFPHFGLWLGPYTQPWSRHPCGQQGTFESVTPCGSQPRGSQEVAPNSTPWEACRTATVYPCTNLKASKWKISPVQHDPAFYIETQGNSPCFAPKGCSSFPSSNAVVCNLQYCLVK